ncbi:MAG: hypothetical protein WB290_13235 [Smithella sp.]
MMEKWALWIGVIAGVIEIGDHMSKIFDIIKMIDIPRTGLAIIFIGSGIVYLIGKYKTFRKNISEESTMYLKQSGALIANFVDSFEVKSNFWSKRMDQLDQDRRQIMAEIEKIKAQLKGEKL